MSCRNIIGLRKELRQCSDYPTPQTRVSFGGWEQFGNWCSQLAISRSQTPRSFWLATGIVTSGQLQLRKSAIHGLPVTLPMLRVKSDKSDWWSRKQKCFQKCQICSSELDVSGLALQAFSSPEAAILLVSTENHD